MAFPQTPLPIKVELQLNSTWTDVTTDVRAEQQVRISRGRSDWGQNVDASRCSFTLENTTGKYSPRNPSSPYYGQLGRNTPCRVSVLTGTPYLDVPGGTNDFASTPDTAVLDITGDLDVRLDASWGNWLQGTDTSVTDTVEMIGKFGLTGQKSWFLGSRSGRLYFEWSPDGTNTLAASSTLPPIPASSGRLAIRATLDVDNGAGGWTVRFYTADSLSGSWAQLGSSVSGTGVTSIFNSTSSLRVGNATSFTFTNPVGRVHAAEVRSGIAGTVVASPAFSSQAVGTTSFADSAGRTWTLSGSASITNRQVRFVGEVSSWQVRWDTRQDVVVQVEASGILRRLTQGAAPVRSSMYREFTNPTRSGIVSYWPMEDEAGSTVFASALPSQTGMPVPTSGVTLAAYSDWPASAPLPTFTFGTTKVPVANYTASNYLFTRASVFVPAGGVTGTDRLLTLTTTGTARTWTVWVNSAGSLAVIAYDANGTTIYDSGFDPAVINGAKVQLSLELTQSGVDINVALYVFYIDNSTLTTSASHSISTTLLSYTIGSAADVRIGLNGLLNGTAIGHLAIANAQNAFAATTGAMIGWLRETATSRVARLAEEEGFTGYSAITSEQTLGTQDRSTLVDLLRECEAADAGILIEDRDRLGLRLRGRLSLYNQQPALTLNYAGSDGLVTPLEPTDDDQAVRNDITVSRSGGSSVRATLDTGALSTQAPPSGVGRYTDSTTLNLPDDSELAHHAWWQLHVATWDETRYPVVRMMLAKAPSLLETAAAVDVGARIQITNPPSWLPPGTIDLMVQGYTETLDAFTWDLDFNCTPAGPWDVAWAGETSTASAERLFAWVDTDGSALAEDLTTTETDVDLLTTAGPRWTDAVSDTPFDLKVGGEVMTVVAPGSFVNSNAFFDVDTTGWTGSGASIARSQAVVHPHPRAVASLQITPTGAATATASGAMTAVGTIAPGGSYVASMWVYSVTGWSDVRPTIDWYNAAGTLLSSSTGSATSVAAGVWTYLEATYTAPTSASRAVVGARLGATPTASNVHYVWAVRVTKAKASWAYDTFNRTASSGWGTAESGQTWNTVGGGPATDYSVGSGVASHVLSTVDTSRRTAITAASADFDIYCDVTTNAAATGDTLYGGVTARMQDASNMYLTRVEFNVGGAIFFSLRKIIADVQTDLGFTAASFTHTPGQYIRVRFQGVGSTLRAKGWLAGTPEPSTWHLTATDTSITAANQVGFRSIRTSSNTNAATVAIQYDNYEVIGPQTVTVVRSQNGVVKTQTTGTSVSLANPAYIAL